MHETIRQKLEDGERINYAEAFMNMPAEFREYSERCAHLSQVLFCECLKQNVYPTDRELNDIAAGYMHAAVKYYDIGFAALPEDERLYDSDEVTHKGRLESHVTLGRLMIVGNRTDKEIIDDQSVESIILSIAYDAVIAHHERWDGKGTPYRLKGTAAPIIGRICAICDTYELMTGARLAGGGFSHEYVSHEIVKQAGKKFDPVLVSVFGSCSEKFRESCPEPVGCYENRSCGGELL